MSTLTTRQIGGPDRYDRQAVKVQPATYAGKWGILDVSVTTIALGTGGPTDSGGSYAAHPERYSLVDLRNPTFFATNDTALSDSQPALHTGGTITVSKHYYFAVNNGLPGPGIFVQGDGTWDLLQLTHTLNPDNAMTGVKLVMTYTVSFTDLTPSSQPADTGTSALAVTNESGFASNPLTLASSTFAAQNGYVMLALNSLALTVVDRPVRFQDPRPGAATPTTDSVAAFSVVNAPTLANFAQNLVFVMHPTSKTAGTMDYGKNVMMLVAINGGKPDLNASPDGLGNHVFGLATLSKVPLLWPCDDDINATLHYALAFTAI